MDVEDKWECSLQKDYLKKLRKGKIRQKDFQNMIESFVFPIYDCPLGHFSNLTLGAHAFFTGLERTAM